MNRIVMDLQYFAEEGAAAAAGTENAGGAGIENAAGSTGEMNVQAGDTLPDGQQVQSAQVAAELKRQMKRHPELRQVYGQAPKHSDAGQGQTPEDAIQAKWEALKKGEYKDLYGADVQAAVQARFKNQADAQAQLADVRAELDKVNDVMEMLRGKAGVETNDELLDLLRNDDSLIEDEAEAAGMTVDRYREFKALQEEHDRRAAEDQENIEKAFWDNHFAQMTAQAEALKQIFPDFDLRTELDNEEFARLTHPKYGNLSVEDAYYTVHRKELEPQMMAYGMERAKQQMSQTIQAQRARPMEGAMRMQGQQAATVRKDFSSLDRKARDEYRRKVLSGQVKGGDFA